MKKGTRKSKIPLKPEDWPTNPQTLKLSLSSFSFPQTGLRAVDNKPPFLRCLIHPETMATNGISTDFPLEVSHNERSIVVHAWPSAKTAQSEVAIDDQIVDYLGAARNGKIVLDLKPIEEFETANQIGVRGASELICRLLPFVYSGLVIKSGSVVFFRNRRFEICEHERPVLRVFESTRFYPCEAVCRNAPVGLEAQFAALNEIFGKTKEKRCVLISGPSGCGKTVLAEAFLHGRSEFGYAVVSVPSLFSGSFGAGEQYLRSLRDRVIVLLENAEVIGNDEVSRRLVTAIADLCESTSVIVTTSDMDSFPTILRQVSRVSDTIEIESPPPDDRFRILSALCGEDFAVDDIREAANSATGFVGGDLQRLVSEAIVDNTRLTQALSRVKPASLRHISLEIPEVHWDDIGGYDPVKLKLRESVTLPLEKPECFTRLGIRPPRGVLLYGPPGCSKTLMAKAVATESKMNFIAVKGPELFSKFVGESEKAVASVFKKARNAAPSIIFFDEIDAMATRRGSSSDTGSHVTDRVLTQLLTEMDGISTRFNLSVVVIAATNRPDLLDPALLRPGRFDRLVYVALPDEAARREVFTVHLRKMKHEDGIDVSELARATEGYSGAEIAAVCREAAMNALREAPNARAITLRNLRQAMDVVKPRTPKVLLEWYQSFEAQRKY
jgi:SpoVK/Ycf46/Vps4 family AAA+-type ATPase